MVTNPDGLIVYVNPTFEKTSGYTLKEVFAANPRILKSGLHDDKFYKNFWNSLLTTGEFEGEIWNRKKNGELYLQWINVFTLRDPENVLTHYAAIFYNMNRFRWQDERVDFYMNHDALTGLPNRHLFMDRLAVAIKHGTRTGDNVAAIFINLDQFKHINDVFGYSRGDDFIRRTALRLMNYQEEGMSIYRHGGDEYFVLIDQARTVDDVARIARKLLERISEPFRIKDNGQEDREFYITASAGISIFPLDGNDPESLINNAELAMYQAKSRGKNNYSFYKHSLNKRTLDRLSLENDLRNALDKHEIEVYYQPRINLQDGFIVGMEALARWRKEDGLLVNTADFIEFAEESRLIIPIGAHILHKACETTRRLNEERGLNLSISVNVSAFQFQAPDFSRFVRQVIKRTALPGDRLVLEITESVIMDDLLSVTTILKELKALGVRISIDDFGSGYSSLNYLKHLPLDELKIDRMFLLDVENDERDQSIIEYITALGHRLKLDVVVEGLETRKQLEFLKTLDCDQAQGYLVSPPVREEEFIRLLEEKFNFYQAMERNADNPLSRISSETA